MKKRRRFRRFESPIVERAKRRRPAFLLRRAAETRRCLAFAFESRRCLPAMCARGRVFKSVNQQASGRLRARARFLEGGGRMTIRRMCSGTPLEKSLNQRRRFSMLCDDNEKKKIKVSGGVEWRRRRRRRRRALGRQRRVARRGSLAGRLSIAFHMPTCARSRSRACAAEVSARDLCKPRDLRARADVWCADEREKRAQCSAAAIAERARERVDDGAQ